MTSRALEDRVRKCLGVFIGELSGRVKILIEPNRNILGHVVAFAALV